MEAVILAAGLSSRAGDFKLAWPIEGKPLLVRQAELFAGVCDRVYVVAGHWLNEVRELVRDCPRVEVVENPDYLEGMFSSVQAGVARVTGDFFICPSDYPAIAQETLAALAGAWGQVRIPTFDGRRGHPLFMTADCQAIIAQEPRDSNLRNIINRLGFTGVPVNDEGILHDIDTKEDYRNYQERSRRRE
ncbi:MAG: nucleotidyltransferase family protein [Spirochaetales bacterium]|nr:nucleotidyltransferase family protein [Spirochaetales bacterium]